MDKNSSCPRTTTAHHRPHDDGWTRNYETNGTANTAKNGIEEVRPDGRDIAEEVRRERIQRAAKCMRYNRKWFDDENRVRGKGDKAPFDSELDVLELSPAEWKEVDAALALTKQRREAQEWPVSDS